MLIYPVNPVGSHLKYLRLRDFTVIMYCYFIKLLFGNFFIFSSQIFSRKMVDNSRSKCISKNIDRRTESVTANVLTSIIITLPAIVSELIFFYKIRHIMLALELSLHVGCVNMLTLTVALSQAPSYSHPLMQLFENKNSQIQHQIIT